MDNPADPVRPLIREQWRNPASVFVFPSDIAASLWLGEALEITGASTLAAERFIAWDRFKEEAVRAEVEGKSPVSAVVRKLWARALAEANAEAAEKTGTPLLASLIPAEYSSEGNLFASWIARILPQLGLWEIKHARALERGRSGRIPLGSDPSSDGENRDLSFVKHRYEAFLEREKLFEPSWQRPPLKDGGKRYFIFFPEAVEDFGEYAPLFSASPFITLVSQPKNETPRTIRFFENTREEIRDAALSIEALLIGGLPSEKIAVSVPDLETASPYLRREFELRGIPFELRTGEPLGSRPAGRIFRLINECVSSGFSFSAMKALLLNRAIPWKHGGMRERLVEFGIRNHCVASWSENGETLDIWAEAFKTPNKADPGDWLLRDWYRLLRNRATSLCSAKDFPEIRRQWFAFRRDLLNIEEMSPADNDVLARCIEELSSLERLGALYPELAPRDAFSFFANLLEEVQYVSQRSPGGVSVFPWRVAAGTPFERHFILDASQDNATVLYRQLPFLREDKRLDLFLMDTDASASFFEIYRGQGTAVFSFAERSFTGYRTVHGHFANGAALADESARADDPYEAERLFRAGASAPRRLYPIQKKSIAEWNRVSRNRGFSFLKEAFENQSEAVSGLIDEKKTTDGRVRVSQSDLSEYGLCRTKWFLNRLAGIEVSDSDAELMNDRNLGLVYHSVLKDLYEKIRSEDEVFVGERRNEYLSWAENIAQMAASGHAEFNGPLAQPIIDSLIRRILEGIAKILDKDAEFLDGFVPEFLEERLTLEQKGALLNGVIDRISRDPADNALVIIDYKSGKAVSGKRYIPDEENRIGDFQIPMYIRLAEQSPESPYLGQRVEYAWFASIRDGAFKPIVQGEGISMGRLRPVSDRDGFEPTMEAFDRMVDFFEDGIRRRDFTRPEDLSWAVCQSCDYRRVCRAVYSVAPGLD